ncbi:MAG: ferrous iron transporter B [Holosporaceae bacterium]|jgi:ferrous iron transport protein B|nr:ferrous iron transporter B [Holosporaceae bacterium]
MFHCDRCPFKRECNIVLAGNPNVGKSSIFHMLSGKYAEVSNYPGTSVAMAKARIHSGILMDTPGIYGLGDSQVEKITKEYMDKADVVVNVVGALTIDRDLFLTKQLMEMNCRLILVVNQIDEAEKRGISIDCEELSRTLGVRVVKTAAIKGVGRRELMDALQNFTINLCAMPNGSANVGEILGKCIATQRAKPCLSRKIDGLLLNPIVGLPVAALVLYALFKVLGVIVSGHVVDYLVSNIDEFYVPMVAKYTARFFGDSFFSKILSGEFGIFTMVVKMVCGILLPLIAGFYVVMSLLEDSGYIPRLTVLTNKFFNFLGLNGDAMIPMLLGLGCGAMGTISTRILGAEKEKIIATALVGIGVPCAAQQGIIIALLASRNDAGVWFTYVAVMLAVTTLCGMALNFLIKGDNSNFVIDIPPLRIPSLKNCCRKTTHRVRDFIGESLPIFALSSVFITTLNECGALRRIQLSLSPIVENLLHLPREFSDIFVMGIIRRDFASAGVFNMSENLLTTNAKILTATVVVSLFVPCINAVVVILKERGWRMALALWTGAFIISIAVGSVLTRSLEALTNV